MYEMKVEWKLLKGVQLNEPRPWVVKSQKISIAGSLWFEKEMVKPPTSINLNLERSTEFYVLLLIIVVWWRLQQFQILADLSKI